jgi:hypothetical protein
LVPDPKTSVVDPDSLGVGIILPDLHAASADLDPDPFVTLNFTFSS